MTRVTSPMLFKSSSCNINKTSFPLQNTVNKNCSFSNIRRNYTTQTPTTETTNVTQISNLKLKNTKNNIKIGRTTN